MLRMLRGLHGQKGQGTLSEYMIVIVIAVGAVTAMSIYVRRAYQGRVRDVNYFMMNSAHQALNKSVVLEYEPYYVESVVDQVARDNEETRVFGSPGIYIKNINSQKQSVSKSVQYPPKNAI